MFYKMASLSGDIGGDLSVVGYTGTTANQNITFSNLTVGKKYLVAIFGVSSNQSHAETYGRLASISNSTYKVIKTQTTQKGESNSYVAGIICQCVPTSTSITINFEGSTASVTDMPRQAFIVAV